MLSDTVRNMYHYKKFISDHKCDLGNYDMLAL